VLLTKVYAYALPSGVTRALKPLQAILIVDQRLRKNLQCDIAAETKVGRAIDLPHPARAERSDDLVVAEARTDFQRHE
jgi:hypothetical protein